MPKYKIFRIKLKSLERKISKLQHQESVAAKVSNFDIGLSAIHYLPGKSCYRLSGLWIAKGLVMYAAMKFKNIDYSFTEWNENPVRINCRDHPFVSVTRKIYLWKALCAQ